MTPELKDLIQRDLQDLSELRKWDVALRFENEQLKAEIERLKIPESVDLGIKFLMVRASEVTRLRAIEAAAKKWAESQREHNNDCANAAEVLYNLVSPPKRPEPQIGMRVKWMTVGGISFSGRLFDKVMGGWMVAVDPLGVLQSLPDNWEPE